MAIFRCSYYSTTLQTETKLVVTIPGPFLISEEEISLENQFNRERKYPVVYLLHGATDNEEGWLRYTSVERYAREKGVALVLPYVENSFYLDMEFGPKYYKFISEELPMFINANFQSISSKREDTFVAGLSMGGYGALLLALRQAERFSKVASLSGAVDPYTLFKTNSLSNLNEVSIFGDIEKIPGSDVDLKYLLEKNLKDEKDIPKIYLSCGTEDFLYDMNQDFLSFCKEKDVDITYEEGPGEHSWDFWDKYIQNALEFFDIPEIKWNDEIK